MIAVEDAETKGVRAQYVFNTWEKYTAFEKSDAGRRVAEAQEKVRIRPIAGFLGREDKADDTANKVDSFNSS
ncbi:MAG: hypothetical protein EOO38_31735 [Cytophagaceae bacterium]|nr:MAG: hypothetical protein EOO38_31735 [Cytophagaceae bacterium]